MIKVIVALVVAALIWAPLVWHANRVNTKKYGAPSERRWARTHGNIGGMV
jgi:hypothetical protein